MKTAKEAIEELEGRFYSPHEIQQVAEMSRRLSVPQCTEEEEFTCSQCGGIIYNGEGLVPDHFGGHLHLACEQS